MFAKPLTKKNHLSLVPAEHHVPIVEQFSTGPGTDMDACCRLMAQVFY